MAGNGDEHEAAAWQRVEAKLDRLAESSAAHTARLDVIEHRLLSIGAGLDSLPAQLELTRKLLERKLDLLRLELLEEAASIAKLEARGGELGIAQRLDELADRLAALERRIEDAPAGE